MEVRLYEWFSSDHVLWIAASPSFNHGGALWEHIGEGRVEHAWILGARIISPEEADNINMEPRVMLISEYCSSLPIHVHCDLNVLGPEAGGYSMKSLCEVISRVPATGYSFTNGNPQLYKELLTCLYTMMSTNLIVNYCQD